MNILISSASGLTGSTLVETLFSRDCTIQALQEAE